MNFIFFMLKEFEREFFDDFVEEDYLDEGFKFVNKKKVKRVFVAS